MKSNLLQFSAMVLFAVTGLTASSQSWLIAGNSNTTNANFIGTKNNQPLIFRTNNIERMRLTKNGQLGIGLTNPSYSLQVTNASFVTAIYGYTTVSAGNGIVGECDNGASAYGVYGVCSNTTSGFAGVFSGNLFYTGTLSGPSDEKLKEKYQTGRENAG